MSPYFTELEQHVAGIASAIKATEDLLKNAPHCKAELARHAKAIEIMARDLTDLTAQMEMLASKAVLERLRAA